MILDRIVDQEKKVFYFVMKDIIGTNGQICIRSVIDNSVNINANFLI